MSFAHRLNFQSGYLKQYSQIYKGVIDKNDPIIKKHFDNDIEKWMHNIRIFGKKGAHHNLKEIPTKLEAIVALEQAFKVGRFFYNRERFNKHKEDFDASIYKLETHLHVNEEKSKEKVLKMDKDQASKFINQSLNANILIPKNGGNVRWANINSSKNVWWINITYKMFNQDIHLILNDDKNNIFYWLKIDAMSIHLPKNIFKDLHGMADIELDTREDNFLIDVKNGGKNIDFSIFLIKSVKY